MQPPSVNDTAHHRCSRPRPMQPQIFRNLQNSMTTPPPTTKMHPLASHFHPKFPGLISHVSSQGKHKNLVTKITSYPSSIPEKPTNKLKAANPKKKHLLEYYFNSFDNFISNFFDLPLTPIIDPDHVLSGNFAPVEELPPTACEVLEGSLPACLDGVYIRNGPNPQFIPRGPYHLLDGDGMLHSIKISGGAAIFCSRYVKTYKFITEGNMGYPFFPSPFSSFNGKLASAARFSLAVARGISGYFNPVANGFGTANTSLAFFGGTLYALCESDLPYQIEVTSDGDIVTLGRRDFGGGDPSLRMTAHPQIDSETGEVFAFRCNMFSPFLTFFKIDSAGRKGPDLPIHWIKKMPCIHDFALTKRFIIFQDGQIEMDPLELVKGRAPLVCDPHKLPRIGVLPRDAADDGGILWFEAVGLNILHVINAWEEECGGRIVILAPNFLSVENGFHNTELIHSEFEMITVDINAKKVVSRHVLCSKNTEFGIINQAYAGKKNKYMYGAVIAEMPKAAGVVKLDLSRAGGGDCTVARRVYGEGCYGGETYFVARDTAAEAEEDDGYLVTYVHDEKSMESWFWVMDAKSPCLDIVARVRLPVRVPYGFHGLFVSQNQLNYLQI